MDDDAAPPDNNISSNSPSAPPPEVNEESGSGPTAAPPSSPAAAPHHRRSKREKYSPSRFVARPSSRKMKSPPDNANAEDVVAAAKDGEEKLKEQIDVKTEEAATSMEDNQLGDDSETLLKSKNETTPPPINNDANNTNTNDNTRTTRRRTPRAHAAPKSYTEPPDNIDDEQMNIDSENEHDNVITKTCHNGTIVQISTIKLHNKKGRSLCKVIGCGKNDQMGNEGYCRSHFRLLVDQPEQEEEEEEEEEIEEQEEEEEEEEEESKPPPQAAAAATYFDPSPEKPRKGSTVRILFGDSTGLEGDITKVTIGGWCTIDNPNVPKPIRMSSLEVVRQNGPPLPKKSPGRKKWSREVVESVSRRGGGGGRSGSSGRPVRERKPPQSLLMAAASASEAASSSPMSPSRPRRSTRGATPSASSSSPKRDSSSTVRRSKRGPTPSPKYADVEDEYDDEEEEEEEEEVRPRGRRGRSSTTPSKLSSSTPKSSHLCKAPSCTKYRQGACEGYCTTCYKLFTSKDPRLCKIWDCTKIHQYKKDGYCQRHYREFVLEGGVKEEEVEEVEEVVSPPKKRARRAVKQEVVDEEEEDEEEDEDNDVLVDENGEAIFDAEPRRGTQEQQFRLYCKVKLCDKFSQGRHKDGMCFKHFKQYGFVGETKKTKKKTKKKKKLFTMTKKSRSRSAVGKPSPAAAAAAEEEVGGEIVVNSLVMVKERMGTGMNKPGGVGRVTKVYIDNEGAMVYDVKYVLGGREKGVDANSLWLHDMDAKSPMKPPPSFDEEGDVAMLDEDDESIEDDELEGYDEFSLSQLDVPDQSVLDQRALRREEQLNALSGNNVDDDYDDHNLRLEENWECAKCGGLNRPTATSRCTTCHSYRVEKNASEDALHERTRYELLNGNDFWICTNCVIGVPSLLMPCGRCHSSIPFVPLTMPEFEDFVRHQRRIKRKREEELQWEWDQKLEEISEEWGDKKEKDPAATTKSKKQKQVWSNLPCKVLGCKEICAPDCEGFCEDHFRSVIVIEEPEAYPIVRPEDKQLITDYFYLAYEQFRPCVLQDWELTTKHKDKNVPRGHPGIACKHCFGRENPTLRSMGRYFPTTEGSLYQQTFTSNIVKHLMECPHCPSKVKSRLVSIKEELDNAPSDGKKSAKFVGEKGGRGKFFHRIWCRLHGIHFDVVEEAPSPKKKRKKN